MGVEKWAGVPCVNGRVGPRRYKKREAYGVIGKPLFMFGISRLRREQGNVYDIFVMGWS
jgi:hypothetical protein